MPTPTSILPGNVQNVVTEYRYGPGGQLVELIAKNPVTGDQVTRYEYGTTLKESGIASNRLLRAEVYPDSKDSQDRVTYSYNRQGQRTRMTDQNGSVHEYEHDLLGRQTADKVTTLGNGVDGAVRRIGTSYEVRGMVEKVTSYSDAAGTTPVNEVQNVYNSFGQLKEQYQEHSGAVNTGTTPKVQYAYADGSANTTRPMSMTYPNGRVLDYLYDDTHADRLSRIRTLRWDGTDVCRYSYLGLNTFVTTDYLQPQVKLDYALGSGANPYAGFDRFGRITDLLWTKYGANSSSSSSSGGAGNDLVHLKYGYDRASNRTFREDLVAQSYGKDFDELYEYDGLHRLKKFHRGRLTDDNRTITSPALQQGWQLDATGNWRNFTQSDQADPNQTLDQQRISNRVNEITQIARTVGADWATPEYDRNGNMTVIPQPREMTQTFQGTWDAWNRLVKLDEPDGGAGWQTLQENTYNGQTWRIIRKDYVDGSLDETRHFFYTSQWQDIEERLGISTDAQQQYVWGLRYINDLISRDSTVEPLEERLLAFSDANWNIVATLGQDAIDRRIVYSPYGSREDFNSVLSPISTSQWSVTYAGYQQDNRTMLYNVRHRLFNSSTGTWISRDPLGINRTGLWPYNYADSSPLSFVDSLGLLPHHAMMIAEGGCRSCGPDVTAWFATEVAMFREKAKATAEKGRSAEDIAEFGEPNEAVAAALMINLIDRMLMMRWLSLKADYKMRNFSHPDCPNACANSVTLGGVCVGTNQLGNIIFGIIAVDLNLVQQALDYGHGIIPWYMKIIGATGPRPTWDAPGEAYRETAVEIGIEFARTGVYSGLLNLNPSAPVGTGKSNCTPCAAKFDGKHTDWNSAPLVDLSGNIKPGRKPGKPEKTLK